MKAFRLLLPFALVISIYGCLTCKKPFTVFQTNVNNLSLKIKTDGIYVSAVDNVAFFFYSNGLIKECSIRKLEEFNKGEKQTIIETNLNGDKFFVSDYDYITKEHWGVYTILPDSTITIQTFGNCGDCACKRMVIQISGKAISDSTFETYSTFYSNNSFSQKNKNSYYFISTTFKPDINHAWFKNKHWYKKSLHPSRKQ